MKCGCVSTNHAMTDQNATGVCYASWKVERERDNVVYWKTKRKIKNDLQWRKVEQ
jgi:hypothetical protein